MKFLFLFVCAFVALASFVTASATPTSYPSARELIEQFFFAMNYKRPDLLRPLFSDSFSLNISDYECHTGLNKSESLTYLNSSMGFYHLMHRIVGEVIQVGPMFAASFVDMGVIFPSFWPKDGWNFLGNGIVWGSVTRYDKKLDSLSIHLNFSYGLDPDALTAATRARGLWAARCTANASEIMGFYDPLLASESDSYIVDGDASDPQNYTLASFAAVYSNIVRFTHARHHCAVLLNSVIPGCGFVVFSHNFMYDTRTDNGTTMTHGFGRLAVAKDAHNRVRFGKTEYIFNTYND